MTFPGSPKTLKGALVGFDVFNPVASVVVFQYNPQELTRSLAVQASGGEGSAPSEALRLQGPPVETLDLRVEIDAADQLEKGEGTAVALGIYPQLSALEMLIYPKSALVVANTILAAVGTLEIVPPVAPFTLFIWGAKRVLPVRLTTFSVTEQAHDPNLNPIRAEVNLGLRVLSYDDFPIAHPGYHVFLAHQVVKEAMATVGSVSNLTAAVGGDVKLF